MEKPPVEPDLFDPWRRSVWLYGLRTPFSLVFLGWITFAQALSPSFNLTVYSLTIAAAFLGLVVGAHYIDIASSIEKFSPFFEIPRRTMLTAGVVAVLSGAAVGVYISFRWNILFLVFVALETFTAVAYPREKPKVAHSYPGFGLAWGTIPFLASYYIQAGTIGLTVLGLSFFVGLSVIMMHHLAIMSRDSTDWKNALYLLRLYRLSVYILAILSLAGRLIL